MASSQRNLDSTTGDQKSDSIEELLNSVGIDEQKLEGVRWLQEGLDMCAIRLYPKAVDDKAAIAKLNLFPLLQSGVLLCKSLNAMMKANPDFIEQNLPVIEINEKTDVFAHVANLTSFVRTAELYFNVDHCHLVEPSDALQQKSDKPFIKMLYFLKLVSSETGLAVPVTMQGKPFTSLTFDQLSDIIAMVSADKSNPRVAYDPRVVMSVQDVEQFKALSSKVESMEKLVKSQSQQVEARLSAIEKNQQELRQSMSAVQSGILNAIQEYGKINQSSSATVSTAVLNTLNEINGSIKDIQTRLHGVESAVSTTKQQQHQMTSDSVVTTSTVKPRTKLTNTDHAPDRASIISTASGSFDPTTTTPPSKLTVNTQLGTKPLSGAMTGKPIVIDSAVDTSNLSLGETSRVTSPTTAMSNSPAAKVFRLPDEVALRNLSKEETMRQSVIYEIIETEADYVRDINILIELHLKNIRSKRLLDERAIKILFSNVEELLPLNQRLLGALISRRDDNPHIESISDIFNQIAGQFTVYDRYCANYPLATQLYKQVKATDPMKDYIEMTMNQPDYRGLSLESYLIKPIQRVCKYPLLLRELLKNTTNDQDKAILQRACDQIESVVNLINEKTRAASDREKVNDIISKIEATPLITNDFAVKRFLLREGSVQRIVASKTKERHLFLFNDVVLLCKSSALKQFKFQLELMFDLKNSVVNIGSVTRHSGSLKLAKTQFELINDQFTSEEPLVLNFATEVEKAKWVSLMEQCFKTLSGSEAAASFHIINNTEQVETLKRLSVSTTSYTKAAASPTPSLKKSNTLSFRKKTSSFFGTKKKGSSQENLSELIDEEAASAAGDVKQDSEVLVEAVRDYRAQNQEQLSFSAGAIMRVVDKSRGDFWKVEMCGANGFIPAECVQVREPADIGHERWQELLRTCRESGNQRVCEFGSETAPEENPNETVAYALENYPDWVAVDAGNGTMYYFNAETNVTSWYPPHLMEDAIEAAKKSLDPATVQKLLLERTEYTNKLQQQLLRK